MKLSQKIYDSFAINNIIDIYILYNDLYDF